MQRPNLEKALKAKLPVYVNTDTKNSTQVQSFCFNRGIKWRRSGNELKKHITNFFIRATGEGYAMLFDGSSAYRYEAALDVFTVEVMVTDLPEFLKKVPDGVVIYGGK